MISRPSKWPVAALVAATLGARLLVPSVPALAQDIQVSASALLAYPRSAVVMEGLSERTHGLWFGGTVAVRMGRVAVSGVALRGTLNATGDVPTLDRDGGEMLARGRYDLLPWLGIEASYGVRAFSSAAGYQRWNVLGTGIVLFRDLMDGGLQVFGRVSYLPSVTVDGHEGPNVALGSETGVSVTPRGAPLTFRVTYSMERYDFPGAETRREQFDRLAFSIGIPLQRSAGGWVLGRR